MLNEKRIKKTFHTSTNEPTDMENDFIFQCFPPQIKLPVSSAHSVVPPLKPTALQCEKLSAEYRSNLRG